LRIGDTAVVVSTERATLAEPIVASVLGAISDDEGDDAEESRAAPVRDQPTGGTKPNPTRDSCHSVPAGRARQLLSKWLTRIRILSGPLPRLWCDLCAFFNRKYHVDPKIN
jgi:hypothetical protein